MPELSPTDDPLERAPLCALVGPTACGKTALALEACDRAGAEVLSMDSMLVYRGLDVGTAKPKMTWQPVQPKAIIPIEAQPLPPKQAAAALSPEGQPQGQDWARHPRRPAQAFYWYIHRRLHHAYLVH